MSDTVISEGVELEGVDQESANSINLGGGLLYSQDVVSATSGGLLIQTRVIPSALNDNSIIFDFGTFKETAIQKIEGVKPAEHIPVVKKSAPRTITPATKFKTLQKWEGFVVEANSDSFVARLVDRTGTRPEEQAEFDCAEVTEEDRELIEPGAIFYWSIGYRDAAGGRMKFSEIRFRRVTKWSSDDVKAANQIAKEFIHLMGWKDSVPAVSTCATPLPNRG